MIIEGVDMVLHRGTTAIDSFESLFKGPCDNQSLLFVTKGFRGAVAKEPKHRCILNGYGCVFLCFCADGVFAYIQPITGVLNIDE